LNTDANGNILPTKDQFGNEIQPYDENGNSISLLNTDADRYKKDLARAFASLIPKIPERFKRKPSLPHDRGNVVESGDVDKIKKLQGALRDMIKAKSAEIMGKLMNGEDVKDDGEVIKNLNQILDALSQNNYTNVLDELKSKVKKLGEDGRSEAPTDKEVEKNVAKAAENKASLYKTLMDLKNKIENTSDGQKHTLGPILEALSNNIANNPSLLDAVTAKFDPESGLMTKPGKHDYLLEKAKDLDNILSF